MTGRYEMWVWLVEEANGIEGVIAAFIPGATHLGPMPLQSPSFERADDDLRAVAMTHSRQTGRPVRLAHLVESVS